MNSEIARIFYEMSEIMAYKKDNWRSQAYLLATQVLESLKEDVEDIYLEKGLKGLEDIPSIGEALAKKIIEFIETGKISKYEVLKKSIPSGIFEMMKIPGVGVKKASVFYEKGIKNIQQLETALRKHKLISFGFKEKSEEKLLEGIKNVGLDLRIPLIQAQAIAKKVVLELEKIPEIEKIEVAGSIRRKKSSIRDIDIVIVADKDVSEKLGKMKIIERLINKGKEKVTFIFKDRQVDIRIFSKSEFGAGLLYFTGDKQHNIWLRRIAIRKNLKLNEYGLFDLKTGKRIAGSSEEEIYEKLGLSYIPSEKRIEMKI